MMYWQHLLPLEAESTQVIAPKGQGEEMSNFNFQYLVKQVILLGSASRRQSLFPEWIERLAKSSSLATGARAVAKMLVDVPQCSNADYYRISEKDEKFQNEIIEVVKHTIIAAPSSKSHSVAQELLNPLVSIEKFSGYRDKVNHQVPRLVLLGFFEAAINLGHSDQADKNGFVLEFPRMLGDVLTGLRNARSYDYTAFQDLRFVRDSGYGSAIFRDGLIRLTTEYGELEAKGRDSQEVTLKQVVLSVEPEDDEPTATLNLMLHHLSVGVMKTFDTTALKEALKELQRT